MGWVLTLLVDFQVLPGNRIPATTVCSQLVDQLVLAGQRQAEPRLSAVSKTQLPPLADNAVDAAAGLSGLCTQRQQPFPQQAVEQLVAGGAVLAEHQDVRRSSHRVAQELFLMTWERDAAKLACKRISPNQTHELQNFNDAWFPETNIYD